MKPINTALLSFGMSGQVFHAPFIHVHGGYSFYSVWERSKDLAQAIYPGVKSVRTLEELLSDQEVELVIVNTPNYSHFEYAKKALEAGKHVVVEKPFTASVAEADSLITLAQKKGVLLSVYQNRRYDSDFRTVQQVLRNGLLGELVEAEFHYDRYRLELSPKVHKENPGPATGSLYDLGSHLIDQALYLFGMPSAVFADIRIVRPQSQVDDYFEVLLYYPGHRVRLRCSYLVKEPLQGYVLHGRNGSFIKPKTDVQETALQNGELPGSEGWGMEPETDRGLLHAENGGHLVRETIPSLKGNYLDYFEELHTAIRRNAPLPVTAEEGRNVIRIIEASFESSRRKMVVDL
jgi:predicted dehydrogenase